MKKGHGSFVFLACTPIIARQNISSSVGVTRTQISSFQRRKVFARHKQGQKNDDVSKARLRKCCEIYSLCIYEYRFFFCLAKKCNSAVSRRKIRIFACLALFCVSREIPEGSDVADTTPTKKRRI